MSDVVDRIDALLAQRNETRNNLRDLGILHQTISQWSTKNRMPRADDLHKIADYLGVSMEYLLTGEVKKMTMDEINIIYKIRMLSPEQKEILQNQLDFMVNMNLEKKKNNSAVVISILSIILLCFLGTKFVPLVSLL